MSACAAETSFRSSSERPSPNRSVFLQDGRNDLNNYTGSWFVANQDMQSALDTRVTTSATSGATASTIRGMPPRFSAGADLAVARLARAAEGEPEEKSRQDVFQVLVPGEDWQVVGEGISRTDGPAVSATGERTTDPPNNRIHKVGLDGKVTVFAENTNGETA